MNPDYENSGYSSLKTVLGNRTLALAEIRPPCLHRLPRGHTPHCHFRFGLGGERLRKNLPGAEPGATGATREILPESKVRV